MENTKKTIIKFLIITILVLGFYYGSQVTPVEEKRTKATVDNFNQLEAVSFDLEVELASSRDGFYDLTINDGYKGKNSGSGSFELETSFDGDDLNLKGDYRYFESDFYFLIEELGPDQEAEIFFETYQMDEGQWVKMDNFFEIPQMEMVEESVTVISEDEEINEKEMYNYEFSLSMDELTDESLLVEVMTGKEDLNPYKIDVDDQLELNADLGPESGFPVFSTGSSPTFKFSANLFDFDEEKELEEPSEYIEI